MAHWVNLDVNFGVPMRTFVASIRDLMAKGLGDAAQKAATTGDPTDLEKFLLNQLLLTRPHLATERPVVFWMDTNSKHGGWRVSFTVMHPSFDRVKPFDTPPQESLEVCPECQGPMWSGETPKNVWVAFDPRNEILGSSVCVCSEKCKLSLEELHLPKRGMKQRVGITNGVAKLVDCSPKAVGDVMEMPIEQAVDLIAKQLESDQHRWNRHLKGQP